MQMRILLWLFVAWLALVGLAYVFVPISDDKPLAFYFE